MLNSKTTKHQPKQYSLQMLHFFAHTTDHFLQYFISSSHSTFASREIFDQPASSQYNPYNQTIVRGFQKIFFNFFFFKKKFFSRNNFSVQKSGEKMSCENLKIRFESPIQDLSKPTLGSSQLIFLLKFYPERSF